MGADIELLPLHLLEVFSDAMKGGRGELDAWLEVNNEADVRLHVEAYTRAKVSHAIAAKDAEIEALRADLADYMAAANSEATRAERLAEALREIAEYEGDPTTPVRNSLKKSTIARAALSAAALKQEAK